MFSTPHTATVRRMVLTYNLKYDEGKWPFATGRTLTGLTSHASATILSAGGFESGTLVIYNIVGTFQNNEVICDDGPISGGAVVDGVVSQTLDAYGQPSKTSTTSTTPCRFSASLLGGLISNLRVGEVNYSQDNLHVLIPPTVTIDEGDTLTSVNTGYANTYLVDEVKPAYALEALHHYTAKVSRLA